jgi:hypothetical protein
MTLEELQEVHRLQQSQSTLSEEKIERVISALFTGLDTRATTDTAAQARRLAAEIIKNATYEQPGDILPFIEDMVRFLEADHQYVSNYSRVSDAAQLTEISLAAEQNILRALVELRQRHVSTVASYIGSLLETFTNKKLFPSVTTTYLSILDVCVYQSYQDVNVDTAELVDLLTSDYPEINKEAADVLASLSERHPDQVIDYIEPIVRRITSLENRPYLQEQISPEAKQERSSRSTPAENIIPILQNVARKHPNEIKEQQNQFISQLESGKSFSVRMRALSVLLMFPGVSETEYEEEVQELLTGIKSTDPELKLTAMKILSTCISEIDASKVPLEPLVDVLESDVYLMSLAAVQILIEIADKDVSRFEDHIDTIKSVSKSDENHWQLIGLSLFYTVGIREPELVLPNIKYITKELHEISYYHKGYRRRLQSTLDSLREQKNLSVPKYYHGGDIRRSDEAENVIRNGEFADDIQSYKAQLILNLLMRLAIDHSDQLGVVTSDLIATLDQYQDEFRIKALILLSDISINNPNEVRQYLDFIIQTVIDLSEESIDVGVRLSGLLIVFRIVKASAYSDSSLHSVLDLLFDLLLLEPHGNKYIQQLERNIILQIVAVASQSALSDTDEPYPETLDPSRIQKSHIDELVGIIHTADPEQTALALATLRRITVARPDLTIPELDGIVRYGSSTTMVEPSHTTAHQDAELEASLEEIYTQHIDESYVSLMVDTFMRVRYGELGVYDFMYDDWPRDNLDNLVLESLADFMFAVTVGDDSGVLPVLDTLFELYEEGNQNTKINALLALEEAVADNREITESVFQVVTNGLAQPGPIGETAAHIIELIASTDPETVAPDIRWIGSAVENASSDAEGIFLARTINHIVSVEPECIAKIEKVLPELLDWSQPQTIKYRDTVYTRGRSADMIGETHEDNAAIIQQEAVTAVATALADGETADAWSQSTLESLTERDEPLADRAQKILEAQFEQDQHN